jgi:hypothetical protein
MASANINTLRMPQEKPAPIIKQVRDEGGFTQSFVAMLNVMRRLHDLYGDPDIQQIITKAERALARR